MSKKRIETQFAGLTISNPIIASSCSLTGSAKANETLAKSGVGAIVLKSLFEEDIIRESAALSDSMMHCEGADYMQAYIASNALNGYLSLIKDSKAVCGDTPIIASINCHCEGEWSVYAKAVEQAGADALELNIMTIEGSAMVEDGELERRNIAIAKSVCEAISIPVIVKLCHAMSNHVSLVSRLIACGVKGVVMFNRLYQTDIDIESMSYKKGPILSNGDDFTTPLRYVAITSAAVPQASLALSGGVTSGECVIKALLAGASAVEVCSEFYRTKDIAAWVSEAIERVEKWQESKGYNSISEYCGTMNNRNDEYRDEVMRAQFLKHFGAYR